MALLGRKQRYTRLLTFVTVLFTGLFFVHYFDAAYSANLADVSVELSTPRLSYYGDLAAGNSAGSSIITIDTGGSAPSTSVANLFEGDTVKVGLNEYTVRGTDDSASIELTTALAAGDEADDAAVIATRSAAITASFETVNAITDGSFRILVPSATADYDDGIPDTTGWDYTDDGATNISMFCPGNAGGHTFGSETATAADVTLGGQTYHSFVCPYTGAGSVGQAFSISILGLINPAPASGHVEGTADQYRILVQHLDDGDATVDQTSAAVAMIESVKVTASVAPQITFTIAGVSSSTSVCGGISTSVTTTATLVPLGELAIGAFTHAAQELIVSTNATGGYVVTAMASDQLSRPASVCTGDGDTIPSCIPDSAGDDSLMDYDDADEWANTTTKGFGYTLAADSVSGDVTMSFEYDANSGGGACGSNTNCYRQFADEEDSQSPEELFNSSSVADNDTVQVCYKAVISNTQEAGTDYETDVTYRATATF